MSEPPQRHVIRLAQPPSRVVPLEDRDEAPRNAVDAMVVRTVRATTPLYQEMQIGSEVVRLSGTYPVLLAARQERYARANAFVNLLESAAIECFVPTLLRFARERRYRLVLPPVLEAHGSRLVVMDGSHRLKALHERGMTEVRCVVVRPRDDTKALPAPPAALVELEDMHVGNYVSKGRKFEDFNKDDFRPVASQLRRSSEFEYVTVRGARAACRHAFEAHEGHRP